jgi:hypothetical protein
MTMYSIVPSQIFPSTDIDQDLNERASFLLNQTFSAHSSDTGHISSAGIGSALTTMSSTYQPAIVDESLARPTSNRIGKIINCEIFVPFRERVVSFKTSRD